MTELETALLSMCAKRFDNVDADNKEINDKVDNIAVKVEAHAVYWSITKWVVPPTILAILGWFGFTKSH